MAILEQASNVVVIPSEIGWHDIGNWSALADIMDTDAAGNLLLGNGAHCGIDTVNSLVFSSDRLVTTIGLEDVIVVDTGDVVLVCPRSRAQDVRSLVQKLRDQGIEGYI